LAEVAAVEQVAQRVVRGELVDLFVVAGFDAGLADELEDALADGDVVAVGQVARVEALVIDRDRIGRAEIADAIDVALAPDPAMLARDALVADGEIGVVGAADEHRRILHVDAPPQALAVDDHEAGGAWRGPRGPRTEHGALRGLVRHGW